MTERRLDVLAIGNAIVDVIANADDAFLGEWGMPKGAMRLDSPLASVVEATLAAWLLSLTALAVPFIAAFVYAATSTPCDPAFAIGFCVT